MTKLLYFLSVILTPFVLKFLIIMISLSSVKKGVLVCSLYLLAFGISYMNYPESPVMNFQRQLLFEAKTQILSVLTLIIMISIITIVSRKSKNK